MPAGKKSEFWKAPASLEPATGPLTFAVTKAPTQLAKEPGGSAAWWSLVPW
jgi:hypothetical protein